LEVKSYAPAPLEFNIPETAATVEGALDYNVFAGVADLQSLRTDIQLKKWAEDMRGMPILIEGRVDDAVEFMGECRLHVRTGRRIEALYLNCKTAVQINRGQDIRALCEFEYLEHGRNLIFGDCEMLWPKLPKLPIFPSSSEKRVPL
jgi:hypothetical protein